MLKSLKKSFYTNSSRKENQKHLFLDHFLTLFSPTFLINIKIVQKEQKRDNQPTLSLSLTNRQANTSIFLQLMLKYLLKKLFEKNTQKSFLHLTIKQPSRRTNPLKKLMKTYSNFLINFFCHGAWKLVGIIPTLHQLSHYEQKYGYFFIFKEMIQLKEEKINGNKQEQNKNKKNRKSFESTDLIKTLITQVRDPNKNRRTKNYIKNLKKNCQICNNTTADEIRQPARRFQKTLLHFDQHMMVKNGERISIWRIMQSCK